MIKLEFIAHTEHRDQKSKEMERRKEETGRVK